MRVGPATPGTAWEPLARMSTATRHSWDPAETTRMWQAVSECVEGFINAWESTGEPPDIAPFVAPIDAGVRRMALIELVKVDLEYRWQRGCAHRRVEEYLAQFPEMASEGLPLDLVYEEFHLRKRAGEDAQIDEYLRRFPEHADELRRMLGLETPHLSTTLFSGEAASGIEVNGSIDDFDILAQLGKGAFATVYLARQRSMQRVVALKVSADRGLEAQTLAQLDHPHIVRVYDQRSVPDRGVRLLYMQYVPGGALHAVVEAARVLPASQRSGKLLLDTVDRALDERGDSPPADSLIRRRLAHASWGETVCWIGSRLAAALDYAHQRGVLHRDVKPANVLLAADCTPKLVDFNIACCSKVEGASPAAYFGGSLAYMSPEQLEACNPSHERKPDELDARSEVYSLAVMLWELLVGRRPFADEAPNTSWPQLLGRMAQSRRRGVDRDIVDALPPDLPAGLKETLLKCLAPEPSDRFPSAADLARQLELCLRPSAQRLLLPRLSGPRGLVRRYPTASLALVALLPNAVLSVVNYQYNVESLVYGLPAAAQESFYSKQIAVVNSTLYAIGLAIGIWLCLPALRAYQRARNGGQADDSWATRQRSLYTGDYVSWVITGAWTISGCAYPIWLAMHMAPQVAMPPPVYAGFFFHWLTSQFLCGLVTGTLAFFGVTYLTVHDLHPMLLRESKPDERDTQGLGRLSQRIWRYFGVAVAVPFGALAVLLATAGGGKQQSAFGVISVMGLIGFFVSFALVRAIQSDLGALAIALAPTGESLPGENQTFDPFSGSNRF
jgi:serine/threonine protein kinase